MKIKFTKLPTTNGTIKVSLDGGDSFTDYNIADIHKSGIPLDDNQDYEKNQIQAPANVLKNLNVVSSVKVEGEGAGAGSTNEPFFIMDTDTYGSKFPSCVAGIVLPNGMTSISKSGFDGYTHLQTIIIPEGVTSIVNYAFHSCTSLTSINIPESVTFIGNGTFFYCRRLTSVTISEGVTYIGERAFCNCSRLTSITIPESVNSIGNSAFYGCSSLKTINYTGTKEQGNAISTGSYWYYGTSFNVIYNYKPE